MRSLLVAAFLLCITSSTVMAESQLDTLLTRSEQAIASFGLTNGCDSLTTIENEIASLEEALTAIGSPSSIDAYSHSLVAWNINGLRNFAASCR